MSFLLLSLASSAVGLRRMYTDSLTSELDSMRSATQTAQHESATAAHQTATMMSLNLKLQSSAAKNQARAVELEIKKLEARESAELLGIVQVGFIFCCFGHPPLQSIFFALFVFRPSCVFSLPSYFFSLVALIPHQETEAVCKAARVCTHDCEAYLPCRAFGL